MKGIATQRYSWSSEPGRPAEEKTLDMFLSEAAEAGYDGVEAMDSDMAGGLQRFGLRLSGAYVGVAAHLAWDEMDASGEAMDTARTIAELGGDYIAVNCNPKGVWDDRERKTDDELKVQGENLTRLADQIAPLGIDVVMHNHADRNDLHVDDLRSVTEYADDSVGILFDTGWSLTSADEPVGRLRELGSRVRAVHLRNQFGEAPTEWMGEGEMDVADCLAALKEFGYDGWLTTEIYYRADTNLTQSLVQNQTRTVALLRELWGED